MKVTVSPSGISGHITAPASKSAMQRACAAALIRKGTTTLLNPGISADDKAALSIIQALGAEVKHTEEALIIKSNGIQPVSGEIHAGESGLSVRMFTSIAAVSSQEIIITGSGSLLKRPLGFFSDVLPQLQVYCESHSGLLPLKIRGPLQPADITVDGSLSSQFLTGLLFAFAAADASDVSITVNNLKSKPYVDLTLDVMRSFGLKTPVNDHYRRFYFSRESATPVEEALQYVVEGDWSGGAFLLVAGAIAGRVTVKGLDMQSSQADKAITDVLKRAGVELEKSAGGIIVNPAANLHAFEFDATDCPDLFPPIVALAAYCNGTSVIQGVSRLAHKESNRALTLQEEFGKLGILVGLQDDTMTIRGGRVKGGNVHSHHDHRIAMAGAVAALGAGSEVVIEGAEAVNKSYPEFWNHLHHLQMPHTHEPVK